MEVFPYRELQSRGLEQKDSFVICFLPPSTGGDILGAMRPRQKLENQDEHEGSIYEQNFMTYCTYYFYD